MTIISKQETLDILLEAKDYIGRGWCKYALARDKNGHDCNPDDLCADSWCILGAIEVSVEDMLSGRTDMYETDKAFDYVSDLVQRHTGCSLPLGVWNDASDTTEEGVIGLLDKVINQLKGEIDAATS